MRILFLPFSAPSHYLPMVPLIWAFRAAGHDVRVAAQPSVTAAVVGSGLPLVPVAESYDMAVEVRRNRRLLDGADSDPMAMFRAMTESHTALARAVAADAVPLARDWRPDLVVGDPLMLAAPIVAARARVPLVTQLWGADIMRMFGYPGAGQPVEDWPESLRALHAEYGCEPKPESATATIDACTTRLQVSEIPSRIPMRFVPYNGASVIPPALVSPPRKRRVLVTWGSMLVRREGIGSFPLTDVMDSLADFDVEIVLAVAGRDREFTESLPPAVRVVENIPLNEILPTCHAIVHHGGSGTMMTAACHGVPQVSLTATPDVVAYCDRMAATGAGTNIPVATATPGLVKSAITEALTNEKVRDAANDLRTEMAAQPAPAEVVDRLVRLASSATG
ncbi:nucleotide disphospho-sugar-binding domain-containing protein [Actinomadura macrotermitis]|uniref:3-alpha-mycarosylerythronolide B desosaminyl transferase n=1 Tax=Actinomadura macrotermitis TaxID=2585200 RepID=A0A7K0BU40_9ACTN|nr:nucleotide disphospho-sugar-binding domain-containing protein [Actinomadura macrotermitis]MQY04671.1 3-alpha-mycarosylerythronolide B desosaminyl transferase [Actinomadura macrotermitis]